MSRWNEAKKLLCRLDVMLERAGLGYKSGELAEDRAAEEVSIIEAMLKALAVEKAMVKMTAVQRQVVDCFLDKRPHCTLASAGNRGGKTFACAVAVAKYIRDEAPAGSVVWCIGPNSEKSVTVQQKYLWDFLPHEKMSYQWEPKNGFGSERPMFVYDGRVQVYFKSQSQFDADPDSFESNDAKIIWVDESISDAAWQALQMRVVSNKGRFIVSTYLGNAAAEWLFEASRHDNAEIFSVFMLDTRDNPANKDARFDILKQTMTPEEWRVRVEGEARLASLLVYDRFDLDRHVVDEVPEDLTYYAGMDIGYMHPTTWLLIGADKDGVLWVVDEIAMTRPSVTGVVAAVRQVLGKRRLHRATVVDNAAFAKKDHRITVAQMYKEAGLEVTPSLGKSRDLEDAQILAINARFEDDALFIHRRCKTLIRELRTWKYKTVGGRVGGREEREDKNNDACFAADTLVDGVRIDRLGVQTGIRPTVRVMLSNGRTIRCTPDHRLMAWDGLWVEAQHAKGQMLLGGIYVREVYRTPGVEPVWCMATETGRFVVEGVTVKNCDALRYCLAKKPVHSSLLRDRIQVIHEP